jgi:hypothetical protein
MITQSAGPDRPAVPGQQADDPAYKPRPRPMISFMISVVPPKIHMS